jgi:hypothetical protein
MEGTAAAAVFLPITRGETFRRCAPLVVIRYICNANRTADVSTLHEVVGKNGSLLSYLHICNLLMTARQLKADENIPTEVISSKFFSELGTLHL